MAAGSWLRRGCSTLRRIRRGSQSLVGTMRVKGVGDEDTVGTERWVDLLNWDLVEPCQQKIGDHCERSE